MNSVVVLAHPDPASFAAAIRSAVDRGIVTGGGAEARIVDLYGDGYRPSRPIPDDHRSALESAAMLVLVHPTWWTAQPAILLGWLQVVAAERWPSIRTVVGVATHGGRRFGNVVAGRAGRLTAVHATRAMSAGRARFIWVPCYGLDAASAARRTALLSSVEDRLARITRRCVAARRDQEDGALWSSSS